MSIKVSAIPPRITVKTTPVMTLPFIWRGRASGNIYLRVADSVTAGDILLDNARSALPDSRIGGFHATYITTEEAWTDRVKTPVAFEISTDGE